jgi:eight-cysteine-cluster-containing protein
MLPGPCDGLGQCIDAPQPPPTSCGSDADCAAGEVCELNESCGAVPFWCPEGDPACDPMPCEVVGICVPANVPGADCWDDSMCAAGEQCVFDYATCDCGGYYPADGGADVPAGVCACPGQCQAQVEPPPPSTECVVTGCSGQICAPAPMATTCEWMPWYECFGLSECGGNGIDGTCGWSATPEFSACMLAYGGPGYESP